MNFFKHKYVITYIVLKLVHIFNYKKGCEKMKKLKRSRRQKMLAGVLGGVAEYFDIDVTIVRLLFVLIAALSAAFPGIILYIVAMFIIPLDD